MKSLFAFFIMALSQLVTAAPEFKVLPKGEGLLSVLAFKNFDYAIRLDNKTKLAFIGKSDSSDTCRDTVKLLERIGEHEKATNYDCPEASGTHVGIDTPDGYKVSYILLSTQSKDSEQDVYDHEIYHALRHVGTANQIAEFHNYINVLANNRINLDDFAEEDAARIVGKLSKMFTNSDLSMLLNHKEALSIATDSPLDYIYYISPSVVKVYKALVSIHGCEPDDPASFIKEYLSTRAGLAYLYASPGYHYTKALSDGDSICQL